MSKSSDLAHTGEPASGKFKRYSVLVPGVLKMSLTELERKYCTIQEESFYYPQMKYIVLLKI